MQINSEKAYQSAKIKTSSLFMLDLFFQAHIQSRIDYASTLWDSASEPLLRSLKSLHRRTVKIILLKYTSLTNHDYKKTTVLPLKHRLMYNKARFMHKIFSYLVKECLSTFIPEITQESLMYPCLDYIYLNQA